MKIEFDQMEEQVIPHFKGGEDAFRVKMADDGMVKIMRGRLVPGASIGLHTHDTSCEVIYILSGTATGVCDGETVQYPAGTCHYCPKGHTHTMRNDAQEDVEFFAIVPAM